MQHQDITYIRIILFWFLTNLDWFLKQSSMLELLETIGNSVIPCLPFSQSQLFWISGAQNWCAKYRPEVLRLQVLTDNHSPPSENLDRNPVM